MELTYRISGIPFSLRLVLFLLIEVVGVAIQTVLDAGVIPGTLLMLAGLSLMWAKSYNNQPKDLGKENWKPVTFREVQRIRTNLNQTKNLKRGFLFNPASRSLIVLGVFATIVTAIVGAQMYTRTSPALGVLDTVIVFIPLLGTGTVKLWKPKELAMKLEAFYPILAADPGTQLVVTPHIRFDEDKEGREIPEDLRALLELRRNPEDFVGVQLQVAINNGPNGQVPYMYAVFLCRGKGATFRKASALDFGDYITEPGGDDEYGTVVVRQQTGGTGYHTTEQDCVRLLETVIPALMKLA